MKIGVHYTSEGRCDFTVWAPLAEHVQLRILSDKDMLVEMHPEKRGYWSAALKEAYPGMSYSYLLNKTIERPDPASCFQPRGVHEASVIIDHSEFQWQDSQWKGMAMADMIMYELHAGTFTREGTFDAIIPRLDQLKDLGINALEIMPVAQFPGERNWGYDGVYPYAVQNSYGGPDGLKKLVNECHKRGMAVILDVVYNHLGPEGNYLSDFGPYFTDRYKTPWGTAINFDGPYSNEVRNYFIENALFWLEHYHIDALRLDAIHGIYDSSAHHFLAELSERVDEFSVQKGREYYLIAESDLNNPGIARVREKGGYGIHGIWCDDFHHSLHTMLVEEKEGYYEDFSRVPHLVKSFQEGYVYSGQYSSFRKKNHGMSSQELPAEKFVIFSQNHDQIGNRMMGERLSSLVSFEAQKLAAATVLLSPYIPLLFMGEEYGDTAPFLYFVSHGDPDLLAAIRRGRKKDFEAFNWQGDPPDPDSVETFTRSRIDWDRRSERENALLLNYYRKLILLRNTVPALAGLDKNCLKAWGDEEKKVVFLRRWKDNNTVLAIFNFSNVDVAIPEPHLERTRTLLLDSSELDWGGPGTLLPSAVLSEEPLLIRAESCALFADEHH